MKPLPLTATRITEISLKLAMIFSQRTLAMTDLHLRQVQLALNWHRKSCQPGQVARRLVHALFSNRLTKLIALITQQKAMLKLAADEGSDDAPVLDALVALSTAVTVFELGPNATPKQRLAFSACEIAAVRSRFAHLVREGSIGTDPHDLRLQSATRRRIASYVTFAMLASWSGMVFITMAMYGTLDPWELAGYLVGSVVLSAYLTRGMFTELRADERTVQDLNSKLQPRSVRYKKASK